MARSERYWRATCSETYKRRSEGGRGKRAVIRQYLVCGLPYWIIVVRGTKQQAQDIKECCKRFLDEELGLDLSEEKTHITHITDGFDFLGDPVFRNTHPRDRRVVGTFARPTDKGLKRVKLKIKVMTGQRTLRDDYLLKLQALNAVIRGWASYYRAVNPMETFKDLDNYVWWRLQIWLQKKFHLSWQQVEAR